MINENVHFRLIQMPCCQTLLCYINHRLPNYCSECGSRIYAQIQTDPTRYILKDDQEAWLRYSK